MTTFIISIKYINVISSVTNTTCRGKQVTLNEFCKFLVGYFYEGILNF